MTAHNFHPKYRPDIDGLRALAILPVVAYHAFPRYAPGGFIGVDIFFVISGYLISLILFRSLLNNDFSFAEFYAHRIKRIFPALILVASTCYAVGWFTLLPDEFKKLGKHIAAGMGFVQNFVLWKEAGYFDVASELKPLMHLWSLAVEEQFYLIFPLLVWAAWKSRLNVLTGVIVLGAISFVLNQKGIGKDAVKTFFAPQTRFWELMAGSALAYVYGFRAWRPSFTRWIHAGIFNRLFFREVPAEQDRGFLLSSILSFLGLALIVYSITKYNHTMPYPGVRAVAPVLGAVLLILAGPQAWVNRQVLSRKVVVWVGLISYPLYLWHWPLLSFARIVESETPSRNIRIAAVAISFILAALTYYLIEKRVRYGRSTWRKVAVLSTLAVLVGYVGYNAYSRDGLDFRFPKIVKELSSYEYDHKTAYRGETCFLKPEQDYSHFDRCVNETNHPKSIFIWGDSHAAHLYPGLKYRFSNEYSIIQRTASGCPPIIDLVIESRVHCKAINDHTLKTINQIRPDRVVLAAIWTSYDLANLDKTIAALKEFGIQKIDIVGPVPQWKDSLPKQLFQFYKSHVPHIVPERMLFGLNDNFSKLDEKLKIKYATGDVRYISSRDIFCDSDGCLTRLGSTGDTLTAWDYGHLTKSGSIFLVSRFPSPAEP